MKDFSHLYDLVIRRFQMGAHGYEILEMLLNNNDLKFKNKIKGEKN